MAKDLQGLGMMLEIGDLGSPGGLATRVRTLEKKASEWRAPEGGGKGKWAAPGSP